MRGVICALYMGFYTLFTAPKRLKNRKAQGEIEKREARLSSYQLAQTMCKGILKILGADLKINGLENLPKDMVAVYMGTHKSYLDIITMVAIVDEPLLFIGKQEVQKIPLINIWFKDIGGIYMNRSDIRQSFQAILEGIEALKEGRSVAIFPEGTRTIGREMGDFKAGSFKLATKANVPIVPITMQDTFKLLEEKGRAQSAKVYVNIGKIIDVPNLTAEQKGNIAKDTQAYMQKLLDESTPN